MSFITYLYACSKISIKEAKVLAVRPHFFTSFVHSGGIKFSDLSEDEGMCPQQHLDFTVC